MELTFVSIGSTCSIAYNLQQLKLRSFAYPFDWLKIKNLENITDCIENNFAEFMDVKELKTSDKFPIFDDDYNDTNNEISKIMINKYEMEFYHDFSDLSENEFKKISQKYNRRIERFNELLKSSSLIYFIRDELKPKNITIQQIEEFINIILSINKNIKLILIIHNPKNKRLPILNYKNDYCIIINDIKPFVNWKRPNIVNYLLDLIDIPK